MPISERTATLAGLFIAASGLVAATQSAEIGSVAAVNRDMLGTPPGATQRDLLLGAKVVKDERIQTTDDGTGQLMFVDQTTLTVAPRSDIVLDRYVFDADADRGEIAITLTRGALRFIGGRISKTSDAIVKTPTATIGIRGGLTLISVNERGFTRVIQLAGEYTNITGPNGNTVTLSRPNASAQVGTTGEAEFTGLVEAEEIAEQFGAMEGGGDGGSDAGGDAPSVEGGTKSVARQNSGVQGAADRPPVSTSGEQEAPPPPQSQESATDSSREVAIESTNEPPPPPPAIVAPPPVIDASLPRGGALFMPSSGFVPFEDIARGSLVGIGPQGEAVRLPIPETAGEVSRTLFGAQTEAFFAFTQTQQSGFAEFGPEDGAQVAGVGPVFGIGFSDLDNGFHFYQIKPAQGDQFAGGTEPPLPPDGFPTEPIPPDDFPTEPILPGDFPQGTVPPDEFPTGEIPPGSEPTFFVPIDETGFVVFGTPSPGQASVFQGDTGQIARTANTLATYRIEPDIGSFGFDEGGLGGPPPALLMVGNGGETRFPTTNAPVPTGQGGRVLVAEMRIENDPSGEQFSDFSVFAAPIGSNGAGSPVIGAGVFSSFSSDFDKSFGISNIGTFEDADGHTVFGPEDNYIVVSSLLRPGGTGPLIFEPGFETFIGGPDFQIEGFSSLLTHDPGAGKVIDTPLGLADDTGSRVTPPGGFDAVFATGIATCSTGDCGFNPNADGPSGVYGVVSIPFEFGGTSSFEFQGADDTVDTNSFAVRFDLTDFDRDSNLIGPPSFPPPTGTTPPGGFTFEVSDPDNPFSAYASDEVFAAFFNTEVIVDGQPAPANFSVASAGLAGDGGVLPASVDATPEFLRWGWWSASFNTFDPNNGASRDDLIHLGTWVAGVQPDPADLPTTGVISYAGLAAGTDANLTTGSTRVVGGNFSLAYDFGTNRGDFDLNIAGINVQNIPVSGGAAGLGSTYGGFASAGARDVVIDGAFVSGGGNPAAGTVGQFQIDDFGGNRKVVGVFGGDAQ